METDKKTLQGMVSGQTATGDHSDIETHRLVDYPIGKYVIRVVLGPSNEFIGITEVLVNKDFLSHAQKIANTGFHDVEEFYRE